MEELELCFPHMPNRSCLIVRQPQSRLLLSSLAFGSFSALIAFLNLLVILSIACFRQLQTSTHRILLSLAVSDFLVGAVLIPVTIRTTGRCWVWGDAACALYFYMATAPVLASVGSMVLISADRYIAVVDPMHYHRRMSPYKVSLSICVIWAYSVLYCFISIHGFLKPDRHVRCLGECKIVSIIEIEMVSCCVVPFSIILIFYVQIFRVVLMKSKSKCSNLSTSQVKQRTELKAARNLGSVIVVYVICYLPLCSSSLFGDALNVQNNSFMAAVLIMYLNSAFNPLLYVLIYPSFRKAFKVILTLKILRTAWQANVNNNSGINWF